MKIRRDIVDSLFSEYIRRKSKGYCAWCGEYKGWQKLQTCHFYGRANKATRWDEANVVAMCFSCHNWSHANPREFTEFFKARLGQEEFDKLTKRARSIVKLTKKDKEELKEYWRNKVKELE